MLGTQSYPEEPVRLGEPPHTSLVLCSIPLRSSVGNREDKGRALGPPGSDHPCMVVHSALAQVGPWLSSAHMATQTPSHRRLPRGRWLSATATSLPSTVLQRKGDISVGIYSARPQGLKTLLRAGSLVNISRMRKTSPDTGLAPAFSHSCVLGRAGDVGACGVQPPWVTLGELWKATDSCLFM